MSCLPPCFDNTKQVAIHDLLYSAGNDIAQQRFQIPITTPTENLCLFTILASRGIPYLEEGYLFLFSYVLTTV